MRLNPWFRCVCGKLHILTWVGPNSVCGCGRNLYIHKYPNLEKNCE